jgi:predicted HTH transcriptional regulator/uncharacterized protein YwbE
MDTESSAKMLENFTLGLEVMIERKRTGTILEGSVIEILDRLPYNEKGIEVKINGNYLGNVKKILSDDDGISIQELHKKIQKHELKNFEMKSSFKYDVNISNHTGKATANNALKRKIVEEAASFMNTDGGILCIGVDNEKIILGLENDYKLQSGYYPEQDKSLLQDQLRLEIKQALKDYLDDEIIFGLYHIDIISIDGKDVCCIILKKSPEPIFVKMKINTRIDGKDRNEKIWKCWIRVDNGIMNIQFDSFLKYWENRK